MSSTQLPLTQSLSISLPYDLAKMVRDKVASGEYATESDVIREGLRSLAAEDATHDAAIEKWLIEEVAPTYDRVMADPIGNSFSADEAHAWLQAHMDEAVRKAAGK